MKILSIETSCDDTAITIFEVHPPKKWAKGGIGTTFKILSNNSNSQIKTHIPYGGVYPMLAKREHIKNLPILFEKTLREADLTPSPSPYQGEGLGRDIDLIAVTYGPGLEMCLWEGIIFAQELAKKWNVPVVPVNHMEGHILSVFGKDKGSFKIKKLKVPILSLLVSGGHTQLVLTKKWMNYEIIGETLDDAVGEAFDKVARMFGLPYPGGPQIAKLAEQERGKQDSEGVRSATGARFQQFSSKKIAYPEKLSFPLNLPRPMLYSKNFDFSFAGLKTAVLYLIKKIGPLTQKTKAQIALEFENAAIECLTYKTQKAIEKYKIKTLVVAGGVAANKHLRNEMRKVAGHAKGRASKKIKLLFPTKELSTDNSIMIGMAGYLNYIKNKKKVPKLGSIKATGNLRL